MGTEANNEPLSEIMHIVVPRGFKEATKFTARVEGHRPDMFGASEIIVPATISSMHQRAHSRGWPNNALPDDVLVVRYKLEEALRVRRFLQERLVAIDKIIDLAAGITPPDL